MELTFIFRFAIIALQGLFYDLVCILNLKIYEESYENYRCR